MASLTAELAVLREPREFPRGRAPAGLAYTSRPVSWLARILIGVVVVLLLIIGALAWVFRSQAEAIPQELAPIDVAAADPQKIVIPGDEVLADLVVADLKGKRAYFILEDRESMEAGESKELTRALARWEVDDDVAGFLVGNAEGFGLLRSKINEFMGQMRDEMRLPLYIDFEGAFVKAFKMPRGHTGLVVLGPDGAVVLRRSGPADEASLQALKEALGARDPSPPPAPEFAVGDLTRETCKGKVCAFAFLGKPVARGDVPGIEGGFEGGRKERFERFAEPSVRLAGVFIGADEKIDEDKHAGAIVGALSGVELRRWKQVEGAPEARAAFGLAADDTGLVVIDPEGRLALSIKGKVRFWQLGLFGDLLGIELQDDDDR